MTAHPVDIWTVRLDLPRRAILSAEERARAARFRFEQDRVYWTRARSSLREILAGYVSRTPEGIEFTYGEHGKPAVEGIEFNLSHTRGWAMIAVSRGVPVGVDIEFVREGVEMGKLLARIGEAETGGETGRLFQVWTRREARTKALGAPLMQTPPDEVRVADVEAPAGFAASVALVWRTPAPVYCCGDGGV
ncbi:MAG: hypothetical protein KGN84_22935 [Acidobacteriota bacterium]|nr:hypothetical protein [Acidobacteriota bacterium]